MSKFNTATTPTRARRSGDTTNLAGGEAFTQEPRVELASILLTSFVKDQYYRSADDTLGRLKQLLGQVDPLFAAKAAVYARDEFGMRSISHVVAGELAHSVKGEAWTKDFFDRIVVRPDDMTEILAYYLSAYGKPVPNSLKKGFARAFRRFDSYKLAKYRGEGKAVSLVDVVNLVRPHPTSRNAEALKALVEGTLRNTDTWEARMSSAGSDTEAKADVWSGLMNEGRMPYFALLRNLRNIEQTGNDELIKRAATQLVEDDPGSHRVLPFRFLAAYGEVTDRRLVKAVSEALDRATVNCPDLPGKTLIAIDHSGSMGQGVGSPKFIGDTFAAITFKAMDADVIAFGTDAGYVGSRGGLNPADSTLTLADKIAAVNHGYGTNFHEIFATANKKYDRIFIFSDMQAWIGYYNATGPLAEYERRHKARPFVYAFDLTGYGSAQFHSERIVQLAGFSEKVFDLIKVTEQDRGALVKTIEAVTL